MKKTIIMFTLTLSLISVDANAGFLSSIANFLSGIPIIGNIVDYYANRRAQAAANSIFEGYRASAMRCNPLETSQGLSANDWMARKPGFPSWQQLEQFTPVSAQASAYASGKTNYDKGMHCYAGCYIRKSLGHSSAVLAGWAKELKDTSDCNPLTHFEVADFEATVAGSVAENKMDCAQFCQNVTAGQLSGSQMLDVANKMPNQRPTTIYRHVGHRIIAINSQTGAPQLAPAVIAFNKQKYAALLSSYNSFCAKNNNPITVAHKHCVSTGILLTRLGLLNQRSPASSAPYIYKYKNIFNGQIQSISF